jgi:hypothetical protein
MTSRDLRGTVGKRADGCGPAPLTLGKPRWMRSDDSEEREGRRPDLARARHENQPPSTGPHSCSTSVER